MFYPNMMHNYGFGPFHMTVWPLFSILIWVFVIVLIVKLVKHGRHGERHSAMSILRERFAKGEISKEEFEERKKVLEAK